MLWCNKFLFGVWSYLFFFKVVAPTISNPACQDQLIEAAREVSSAVDGCVDASQLATSDQNLLRDLANAATDVSRQLNRLIDHIKQGGEGEAGHYDEACDTILTATDRLCSSMGSAAEMVKQARVLGQVRHVDFDLSNRKQ